MSRKNHPHFILSHLSKRLSALGVSLVLFSFAASCTNAPNSSSRLARKNGAEDAAASLTNGANTPALVTTKYYISNVTIGSGGPTLSTQAANIYFDTSRSTSRISDNCAVNETTGPFSKPCMCLFRWTEVNQTGADDVRIPRSAKTAILSVQPHAIACEVPAIYTTEILDGTEISLQVIPDAASGNTAQFEITPYRFLKKENNASGSFTDIKGNAFDNILRYSCFEQTKRGMAIKSRKDPDMLSSRNFMSPVKTIMATQFCLAKAGSTTTSAGCEDLPPAENTAQSYYYNLFIPGSRKGDINLENKRYKCPAIKETLRNTGVPDVWPLDSSFALSVAKSTDFTIGVEAASTVSTGSLDSASVPTSCDASNAGGGEPASDSSMVKKCLGFAAKPKSDGTCPLMQGTSGPIPTYRLRRYVALYPPTYDTDGAMVKQPYPIDTIYVLDRPVRPPNGDMTKPYTMRGPKPCPFSFFDHKGVLDDPHNSDYPGGMPSYAGTNDPRWNKKNVDGIEFPNKDAAGESCSTAMPLFNPQTNRWSIGTINERNPNPDLKRVFIRPIEAWAPHYEEDLDFQACAPQSNPIVDPPLHFSKTSDGNVTWCAEAYPSRNTNVGDLDRRRGVDASGTYPGKVVPFTSHVVKNSVSTSCAASAPDLSGLGSLYPGASGGACIPNPDAPATGVARHPSNLIVDTLTPHSGNCPAGSTLSGGRCYFCAPQTCDRTVQNQGAMWPKFPLIAPPAQVEDALSKDSTYGCFITHDDGGGKSGKLSPREGCCGMNVQVHTGVGGLLSSQSVKNTAAHFEPSAENPCLVPNY